ncbi:MAG TPA: penicillin-binding protein 2 [Acidimicrobiia bacterium]|nr:penicillin-binding protein 2 [Acidimicrobiia bacterium]
MSGRVWRRGDLRLLIVGTAFLLAWVGIGYRLFDLQGTRAVALANVGFDQRIREEPIDARRGTIYDREGVELAMTIDGWNVVVDPTMLDDAAGTAALLAPFADAPLSELETTLVEGQASGRRYAEIAMRVNTAHANEIRTVVEENSLVGVFFREQPLRVYPAGHIAAQVVGLTRHDDNSGIEGIEKTFDSELQGEPGRLIVERDPSGRVIPQGEILLEPATAGSDVITTIDREVQFAAEQGLRKAIQLTDAVGGSVVVLQRRTGAILAMVSWPGLDLNNRSEAVPDVLRNRAVADIYEPGSTLKVVTVAAAIEEGVVTPDTPIDTPDSLVVGDFEYEDHGSNPDWMSVADVVMRSSNVGTIEIQRRLGNELHYDYLTAFGLGAPSGLDVAGERHGQLDPTTRWTRTSGSSIAIGYAVGTTPLQMAAVYAAIANDGVWVEPHLVREIIRADGQRILTKPRSRPVVSPETAATMRRMLGRVVESDEGTGSRARMSDYTSGGKTGTTQKFDVELERYSEDTIASFIGMAPLDDPEIVVVVVLDTPSGNLADGADLSLGGASAAPAFAEIAQNALHQLGIAPDRE